ncbi:unnamed protein product [Parnassius mnemosyne]|uniref:Uncharacterized protein n=1 Tax=Parnassius mnemosyne TaxID=213953 RepID=A0AAV1KUF6_9NEOP
MYCWYLLLLAFLGLSQPITSDRFDGRQCCDRFHQDFSDTRLSLYGSYSDKPLSDNRNLNRAPNIRVSKRIDTKNTNFRSPEEGENLHLRERNARNLFEEQLIRRETVRRDTIKNNGAYNRQTFNKRLVANNDQIRRFDNDRFSSASIESRSLKNFMDLRDTKGKTQRRYLTRSRDGLSENFDRRTIIKEKENDEHRFLRSRIESTSQRSSNEERRSRQLEGDGYNRSINNRARNIFRDRNEVARVSVREDNGGRRLKHDSEHRFTRFERVDNAHQPLIRHNSRIMINRQNYANHSQGIELMFDQVASVVVRRRLNERYPTAARSTDNIAKHETERVPTRVTKVNKMRSQPTLSTERRDSSRSAELRTTRLNTRLNIERRLMDSGNEMNNLSNRDRQFSRTTKSIEARSVLSQLPIENIEFLLNSNHHTTRSNDKRRLTRSNTRESNQRQILLTTDRGDIKHNTDWFYSRFDTQQEEPQRRTYHQLPTPLERLDIHRTERKPSYFATERSVTRRNMAAHSRFSVTRQVNRRKIDLTFSNTDSADTRRSRIERRISHTAFDRSENRHNIERQRTRSVASRLGNQRSIELRVTRSTNERVDIRRSIEGEINLSTERKENRRRGELQDSRFVETRQGDRCSNELRLAQSITERADITRNIERRSTKHIGNRRITNLHDSRSAAARRDDRRKRESRLSNDTTKMADITRVIERRSSEDTENRRMVDLQDSRYVTHKDNRRSIDIARSILKQVSIRHNTQRTLLHNVAERTETRRNMERQNSDHVNTRQNNRRSVELQVTGSTVESAGVTRFIDNIQYRRNIESHSSRFTAKSAETIARSTTEFADTRSCSIRHASSHIALDRIDNRRGIERRNYATQKDTQRTIELIRSNKRKDIRSIEREFSHTGTVRNVNRRSMERENTRSATSRRDNRRNVDFARSIIESADSRRRIIKSEISQTDRSEKRRSMERQYSRSTATHQNNRRNIEVARSSTERSDIRRSILLDYSPNTSERQELQSNLRRLRSLSATTHQDNGRNVEVTHFTSKRANTIPNIERKLSSATERSENRRRLELESYLSRSTTELYNIRHRMHKTGHRMSLSGSHVSRLNNERQGPQTNFRQNVNRQLAPSILELNRIQKRIVMNDNNKQESEGQLYNFNWQLLFYIVQGIYICGLFLQINTDDGNKMKTRNIGLWNPMYQIKVD